MSIAQADNDEVITEVATEVEGQQQSSEMLDAQQDDDNGAVVVTIGDESPSSTEEEAAAAAPEWVKQLRKTKRDQDKELRELRQKLAEKEAPQQAATVAKPTLESCEYDEEEYDRRYDAWKAQDAARAEQQRAKEAQTKAVEDAWKATLDNHSKAKAALRVDDYEDAEATIAEVLNVTQQGIIISGAANSAVVLYALGKNPEKAKELASITDPVKFAFAVAKLEEKMKVTSRKAPPAPERKVNGSASVSGSVDSKLAALEAEADRTGDRSKIVAYKRSARLAAQN